MKKLLFAFLCLLSLFGAVAISDVHAQVFVQQPGDARYLEAFQRDCAAGIALDTCRNRPLPLGCAVGKHWSLAGSGLAHCVAVDPICVGTILSHDALGNPSCVAIPPCANGAIDPPACTTQPVCANGNIDYPVCATPPACSNGATNYPACNTFPSCANSATNYPACNTFPSCTNGNTDYPTCITPPVCSNGAHDYPTCVVFLSCLNGASNYPACDMAPVTCSNLAIDYPQCVTFPQRRCSEMHRSCILDSSSGQSGDPRDTWYAIGRTQYVGPTCEAEFLSEGMNSEYDGGCSYRGINYSESPASGTNYAD